MMAAAKGEVSEHEKKAFHTADSISDWSGHFPLSVRQPVAGGQAVRAHGKNL